MRHSPPFALKSSVTAGRCFECPAYLVFPVGFDEGDGCRDPQSVLAFCDHKGKCPAAGAAGRSRARMKATFGRSRDVSDLVGAPSIIARPLSHDGGMVVIF